MINLSNKFCRLAVIWTIITTFAYSSAISPGLNAAVLESEMIVSDSINISQRGIDEIKVRKALENKIVSERLVQHGLSSEEAQNKIGQMTDEEVHQIAVMSDRLPAGGDGAVGFVAGVLVIAVLVLLIIYLAKRV